MKDTLGHLGNSVCYASESRSRGDEFKLCVGLHAGQDAYLEKKERKKLCCSFTRWVIFWEKQVHPFYVCFGLSNCLTLSLNERNA